jgi:hypothetical protein
MGHVETMFIDALVPDAGQNWTLSATTAYTRSADDRLFVVLDDGSERIVDIEEWGVILSTDDANSSAKKIERKEGVSER